jgi:diguanylate cyclase (GGDEF)-like protein
LEGSRLKFMPLVVAATGLAAIFAILTLQSRSAAARDAETRLARTEAAITRIQGWPWQADPSNGGDPRRVSRLMAADEQTVTGMLERLLRNQPPGTLRRLPALLRQNFSVNESVYRLTSSGHIDDAYAGALMRRVARSSAAVMADLALARRHYHQRAARAQRDSAIGVVVVILALLAGFLVMYRRSANARAEAELLARERHRDSLTDSLTGLPNRRALTEDLAASFALRDGEARVLAIYDLDGFKSYNDSFGHPAGDELLARLGARFATAVQGQGTAYRLGGDEFCLLADVQDGEDLLLVEQAARGLSDASTEYEIVASFGCARIPSEAKSASEALRLADERMYERKNRRSPSQRALLRRPA